MRKSKIKGMTLVEVAITAAIFLIILLPTITLFTKSTEMMYVGDQESSAQKEASAALYNIGQDIQKTLSFIAVDNTATSRFACWIYDLTGSNSTKIAYYRNATDSTIRRVSNYTGSYTGGDIIAQYVSSFTCSFRTDTVYNPTITAASVASVYVGITVSVPGKTYSSFTANSSWWSRNIRTL
jgi:Tfp pilus assembly protein PilW